MSRESRVYLDDILLASSKIEKYVKGMTPRQFRDDQLVIDAVVRNLEIIGEAVKHIPADIRKKHKGIEWKKIAGLRDILIHEYFGVDIDILWDIIKNKLPELKTAIKKIR
ncbi:MAG: DUF86 domain-containing protein [bacterium]